jgi:peptidoglycan/xylan/chitin deacetylase (PgdA/CDA1 family)
MSARALAKSVVYRAAWGTGALSALRWLHRDRIPILCYHSVMDRPLPPWLAAGGLHLTVDRFRAQMEFLARHYRVVPLEQVRAAASAGRRPPIVLTFDDGYANNLSVAAPILAEFGFPATIFLATDYVGRGGMFWWDELRVRLAIASGRSHDVEGWGHLDLTSAGGMSHAVARGERLLRAAPLEDREQLLAALGRAGGGPGAVLFIEALRPATWNECRAATPLVRFGGHGAGHRLLGEVSLDAALGDLERCGRALRTELRDRASPTFCYPAGQWTPQVRAAVRAAGFTSAVMAGATPADEGLARVTDDPSLLPRIGVNGHATLPVFAGNIAGLRTLFGGIGRSSAGAE